MRELMHRLAGLLLFACLGITGAHAQETEIRYLSGRGIDDALPWEFLCTGGRSSGKWTTIPVPSNWELHGFGTYNYGHAPEKATEDGRYRHTFQVPEKWKSRTIEIVFEGAMTDTDVWINGQSAGPRHQGGFYRFSYDITRLLQFGKSNLLEVTVSKDSTNDTINGAERRTDFWIFGGIYRPVYLQSHPQEHVRHVAIDAQADGTFRATAALQDVRTADNIQLQLLGQAGTVVGETSARLPRGAKETQLDLKIANPALWSAEQPQLHRAVFTLRDGRRVLHRFRETFGFRTVDVRPGDGVYLNGKKIRIKGVNRHSFWPDSGRASSEALSRKDVEIIKEMNMNAVRMSHYPPDKHFLAMCDELGLYVLDELAGWQSPYDSTVGPPLVRSMIERDVNHPSVIFWANGNEGGWNTDLDGEFHKYDPQRRVVLHPDANFGGINTKHYPEYDQLLQFLKGPDIYMPTEFLHGLYDGGAGAAFNDYWKQMASSPFGVGGFFWVLSDEGVKRTDRDGAIDTDGNNAPDGILGPYREKEGSFFTIREIWSPLTIPLTALGESFNGTLPLENSYDFTSTRDCRFDWKLLDYPGPGNKSAVRVFAQGQATSPVIAPRTSGTLALSLPAAWKDHDALSVMATDPAGRVVQTWTWPLRTRTALTQRFVSAGTGTVEASETESRITLKAGPTTISFDRENGKIAEVRQGDRVIPFGNGPFVVGKNVSGSLRELRHFPSGEGHVVEASYAGNMRQARWTLHPNGWMKLEYAYWLYNRENRADHDYLGISFQVPEDQVLGLTWLGRGPHRVWKNRLRGPALGLWSKSFNDTETGATWTYPEFKGYHADWYWATLHTKTGDVTFAAETEGIFLRLFSPRFTTLSGYATAAFPPGDVSLLHGIAPIGNKFQVSGRLGPESGKNLAFGDFGGTVYLRFGEPSPR